MNEKDFNNLLQGVSEMGAIMRGEMEPSREFIIEKTAASQPLTTPDVKALRTKLGLTQRQLALFMRVNQRTLQNWEQKRRQPDGPAQVLLSMVEKHPRLVLEALHG
ncbi:MAG: helix-turn-helix domain-containing protein [Proteobacteria bacterium]|jgi:putative transcriptional regulator|nr:helix-turn-helix domain-containing protein [Pseudomonadota bacterium]